MSSSSTYNNVLLKPSIQTQPTVPTRRDARNDYSSADFNQTFKNVSTNTQPKVNEPAKPADKKTTRVDQPRQKVETGDTRKLAKEKLDQKNISKKNADEKIDQEKINKEKIDKQSYPKEDARAETVNNADHSIKSKKSADKTGSLKDEKNTEESDDHLVVNNDAIAVTSTAISENNSPSLSLALAAGFPVGANSEGTLDASSSDVESVAEVLGSALSGKSDTVAVAAPELVSENSPAEVHSETDVPRVLNAQSEIPNADNAQLVAIETPKVVDGTSEKIAETQAAAINLSAPKTPAAKSATSASPLTDTVGISEEGADALLDVPDTLSTDKAIATSVKDANASDALAKTDVKQNEVIDPKTVFEKMLQTVSKSVVREEGAPANSLQNNATNPSPSLTDSFARFNDTQSPATRGFVVQTAVPVPVGQPQWSQAVGEKVLWLAAQNVSSAEINLHPKDLGPIQVKVSVNQEQTSVSFTSHHPMVREVLDQNLNRLRDMFTEQGLNLVNVDVSDKSFSRQQGEGKEQRGQSGANGVNEEEAVAAVTTIVQQRLVDHYA